MTEKTLSALAALNMLVAVGAGAFGAHGLKRMLTPEMLEIWRTAVLYHLIHALGLFIVALLLSRSGSSLLQAAGWVMFAGIVLFCGSLYAMALTQARWLGPVTPLGGLCFLIAWAMVAWACWRA